jgi:predicted ATP-grasp superfamily ATP-dependent carboligase
MACIGCASMRGNRMNRLLMRGGVEKPSSVSYIKPGDYLAYPDSSTVTGMAEQLGALDLTKTEVLVEAIASVPPEVTADVIEKTGQEMFSKGEEKGKKSGLVYGVIGGAVVVWLLMR